MPLFSLSTMAGCICTSGKCSAEPVPTGTGLAHHLFRQSLLEEAPNRCLREPFKDMFLSLSWRSDYFMVTESRIELDVPDLHLSAPLLDRPSTAGQLQGARVSLPFLRMEGVYSLPLHQAERAAGPNGIWEHPAPHCLAQGAASHCPR